MSNFAKKVMKFFDDGLWSESRIRDAVEKGKITEVEYKIIVNKRQID